jgi:hypothetical protein
MTRGIPKKRQRDEQLRKKRAQAAPVLAQGAKTPPNKAIPVAHYPIKRAALGKRQVPGGGA